MASGDGINPGELQTVRFEQGSVRAVMTRPPAGHPLARHVASIFRVRAEHGFRRETILPGPYVDILFNLGDPLHGGGAGKRGREIHFRRTLVSGLRSGPLYSRPTGAVTVVGVNLRTEWCAELLPVPIDELAATMVDGSLLFRGAERLRHRLAEAADFRAQAALLLHWLVRIRRPHPRTPLVRWVCAELRRGKELSATAAEAGMSTRHLRRLFGERVGVNPAGYVRLSRFADSLAFMRSPRTLTDVAYRARYYDQPHFCREFRAFADMTPQEYLQCRGPIPGNLFSV
jgi:AraC-like DNA-binding protein